MAIIELNAPFQQIRSIVEPIQLPPNGFDPNGEFVVSYVAKILYKLARTKVKEILSISVGLMCTVAGWGRSKETPVIERPEKLKILNVKVQDRKMCTYHPKAKMSPAYICAGLPGQIYQSPCAVTSSSKNYRNLIHFSWLLEYNVYFKQALHNRNKAERAFSSDT